MLPPPADLPDRAPRLGGGRYVLVSRVGSGGMAGVYAAWDTVSNDWRATKVLLPQHARDRNIRARFQREARTMSALRHPNLVRVHDVSGDEGLPFIVMELVDGGSLYRWCREHGPMPPVLATEAILQLCAGVEEVHRAGVVHRDIKPRNVLVTSEGVVKLTDFGIAQLEESHDTRTGLAMGTMGYMSPEQLHDAKSVDARTDVYALGATLWTQLTNGKARDLFRLGERSELLDGVPPSLRPVLTRALAYERDDRYPNVAELVAELRAVLRALPPDPPGTPPLPLRFGAPVYDSKTETSFSEIMTSYGGSSTGEPKAADTHGFGRLQGLPLPNSMAPRRPVTGETMKPTGPVDAGDELPEYAYGVDQPRAGLRPETITLTVDKPVRARRSRGWFALVLLVPLLFGAVVLVGGVGAVSVGVAQVGRAEGAYQRAGAELNRVVENSEPLGGDLRVLGLAGDLVDGAWAEWRAAPDAASRVEAARRYASVAERVAGPGVPMSGRSHEQELVHQRLIPLVDAANAESAARAAWQSAASSTTGGLAVALKLASAP